MALLQRLQPLLTGVQSAETFVNELLTDSLQDCLQRVAQAENIPMSRLQPHATAVIEGMAVRLQAPERKTRPVCRALTRKKQRCKRKARELTEFCAHHGKQRQAHALGEITRRQLAEHDARQRASRRKDHTHEWSFDEGFMADCLACAQCRPPGVAVSYSGMSVGGQGGDEVTSVTSA